jgi:hypothetical protein
MSIEENQPQFEVVDEDTSAQPAKRAPEDDEDDEDARETEEK